MWNVKILVEDKNGQKIWEFMAEKGKTLSQLAELNSIDIPIACGAWACFVCAVKVKKGLEYLVAGLHSQPLVEVPEDQVLTCIAWVKNDCFEGDKDIEIIIQKVL